MQRFLNTREAAKYVSETHNIPVRPGTLEVHRSHGKGARYRKVNGRVFYTETDLDEHFIRNARVVETRDSINE